MSSSTAEKTTAVSTQIIVDGVALQGALRAAIAIAPGNPKKEHAVVGVQLPTTDSGVVTVTARDPDTNLTFSATVPTEDVDLVDEMDAFIEITIPEARRLLAQKCSVPKEEDPWPSLAWEITDTLIKQTDAHVLLGRRTDVRREGREQHVLGDITGTLTGLTDAVPDAKGHGRSTAKQIKAVGAAFGHIEENPTSVPLDPGEGQIASQLWISQSGMLHTTIPNPDAGDERPDSGLKKAAQDLHDTMSRRGGPTFTIVGANPPGGIA